MKVTAHEPLSDAELNAMLDGELGAHERATLEARLQHDPAAQQRLARWRAQRDAIRGLHADMLDAPIPEALHTAVRQASMARRSLWSGFRWVGLAAGVLLTFGAGWLSGMQWPDSGSDMVVADTWAAPVFVRDAALAHAVYAPEQRHPVEVAAAEQAHLVQWLSKRTGRALKVPDLRAQAYQLVGGRLLPGDGGARAQFMFENTENRQRITLYMGALAAPVGAAAPPQPAIPVVQPATSAISPVVVSPSTLHPSHQDTAFRFSQDGAVASFYWVDQGFGYALSGTLSRAELMVLASAVYQQL